MCRIVYSELVYSAWWVQIEVRVDHRMRRWGNTLSVDNYVMQVVRLVDIWYWWLKIGFHKHECSVVPPVKGMRFRNGTKDVV